VMLSGVRQPSGDRTVICQVEKSLDGVATLRPERTPTAGDLCHSTSATAQQPPYIAGAAVVPPPLAAV
jgi:hypothetical protein